MSIIYKLFKQDPNTREGVIMASSILGILVNLLCALMKIIVGLAVSSLAIVMEGINNATDATSNVLTIVGTKLAGMHPTAKHPFGFGRIEYLTSLTIAGLIIIAGVEALKSSFVAIFHPEAMDISLVVIALIAFSAVLKFALGNYMIKQGNKINSESLIAVGKDCKADCIVSAITILASAIYLATNRSIDAYAGIITSLFILKAGYETLSNTLSDLLGSAGDKDLALNLYQEILKNPMVINAADMILHNYGPDAYAGSVNIEIDHKLTVEEVYQNIHQMQLDIMHNHNIVMVFGIYAVDADHEHLKEMRQYIGKFIYNYEHVKNFHALYLDDANNKIYCDLVVDYDLADWDKLDKDFRTYMKEKYSDQELELVIETEFV